MKKGFTLVELLGVLVILGILGVVVSQLIIERVKENTRKTETLAKEVIISGARDYVSNNLDSFQYDINRVYCLSFDSLAATEYLDEDMVPKLKDLTYLKDYYVKVIYNGNNFGYEVVETCTAKWNRISISFFII